MSDNPFRGSVQGDAWTSTADTLDVTSIHHSTFEQCCRAVEAVRHGPSSAGIVIHGEPGSGKTHLIGRLRRRFTDRFSEPTLQRISQAFAYVRLNTNEASLARHVRRCVVGDLLRFTGKGPSQLERLALTQLMRVAEGDGHISSWWDYFLEERSSEIDDLLIELGTNESLSPNFIKILGHVVRRQHRLEVAGWLRGDALSEDAFRKLGLVEQSEDDAEQTARQTLIDLMRLAGSEIPLVLCFDQVEALQVMPTDTQPFFTYAKLIADLYDADSNLVLISCMQTAIAEQILPSIPQYAKPRMQGFATCLLKPLDRQQACELLAMRLGRSSTAAMITPRDLAPLTEQDLTGFLGDLKQIYPRELLDKAAKRLEQLHGRAVPTVSFPSWMDQEWDRRFDESMQQGTPSKSEQILGHGIPLLVKLVESDWTITQGRQGIALDHVLTAADNEARVGIKVLDCGQTRKVWEPLKKLNDLFPDKINPPLQKLIILRDERAPISKSATKTLQSLDALEKKDAQFLQVHPEALAALDALRELLGDSQSGDLDFEGKAVSPVTVRDWLRANLPAPLKELVDNLLTPAEIGPTPSIVARLQERLLDRFTMSAEKVADDLNVTATELVDVARSRADLFGVIDGAQTAIFSARLGEPCLSATDDRNE